MVKKRVVAAMEEVDINARAAAAESAADDIADRPYGGVKETVPEKPESKAVFKRCNFSLTQDVSDRIDSLAELGLRITRSDVVKAAILAYEGMSKKEKEKFLSDAIKEE